MASKRSMLVRAAASASSSRPNEAIFQLTSMSCAAISQPCSSGSSSARASAKASRDRSNS
jgi:hypothetical protein